LPLHGVMAGRAVDDCSDGFVCQGDSRVVGKRGRWRVSPCEMNSEAISQTNFSYPLGGTISMQSAIVTHNDGRARQSLFNQVIADALCCRTNAGLGVFDSPATSETGRSEMNAKL
jgi:hypothetical protein